MNSRNESTTYSSLVISFEIAKARAKTYRPYDIGLIALEIVGFLWLRMTVWKEIARNGVTQSASKLSIDDRHGREWSTISSRPAWTPWPRNRCLGGRKQHLHRLLETAREAFSPDILPFKEIWSSFVARVRSSDVRGSQTDKVDDEGDTEGNNQYHSYTNEARHVFFSVAQFRWLPPSPSWRW
jgi:hypothetical protein